MRGVGEQLVDALGALLEAVDHAAEGVEELGQVGEQVEADDPLAARRARPRRRARRPCAASPVGFMNICSERPSMNWVSRLGASRKSSALRVGGVSRTSRSKRPSLCSSKSFSIAMYSCEPARALEICW